MNTKKHLRKRFTNEMPLENIEEKKKISHHTKYYQKTSKLFGINHSP